MTALFVALALAWDPRAERVRVADLVFVAVEEEWVHQACRPRSFDTVLPTGDAVLVRLLGNADPRTGWEARELAEAILETLPEPRQLRAYTWGARARDPEIASRCRRRLEDLFCCRVCGGTGLEYERDGVRIRCPVCRGSGDGRFWVELYGGTPYLTPARDLFGPAD